MPLSFDDLIPQNPPQQAPQAPASSSGLSFDDLIPQAPQAAPPMNGMAPVPTTLETFFKNLPKYPGAAAQSFADLAKGAVTGEILPQSANMPGGEREGDIGAVLTAAQLGLPIGDVAGPLKAAKFVGPTETALEASKTARYESPAITELQLKPEAGEDLSNIIKTDLKGGKLDQFNAGSFYDLADRLKKPRFGDNLSIADLEAARQDAQVEPTAKPNDKRASGIVRNAIDNYLAGNIPENHVLSGDAAAANDALLKARADFSALKRSQDVSAALGRAENQAGSTFSGQNLDNATRQQLRPILNQKTGVSKVPAFQDYTPQEIDALKQAVNGTWLGNKTRQYGKQLAGGGGAAHTGVGLLGALGAEHLLHVDPLTAAAIGYGTMKAGEGFTSLANRMAAARGNYLGDLLRQRSALADEMRAGGPRMIPALWPQSLRFAPMLGLQNPGQS